MTLELLERMIKDCGKKLKPLDEEDVDFHNWDEVSIIQFYKDRYATTIDLPGAGDIYLNKYSDMKKLPLGLDLLFKNKTIGLDKGRPIVLDSKCGDQ